MKAERVGAGENGLAVLGALWEADLKHGIVGYGRFAMDVMGLERRIGSGSGLAEALDEAIAGPMVEHDLHTFYLNDLNLNDLTFHGCTITGLEVFPDLVGAIERGEIRPLLAKTYPLEQLCEAQQAFIDKRHVGNIVVTMD